VLLSRSSPLFVNTIAENRASAPYAKNTVALLIEYLEMKMKKKVRSNGLNQVASHGCGLNAGAVAISVIMGLSACYLLIRYVVRDILGHGRGGSSLRSLPGESEYNIVGRTCRKCLKLPAAQCGSRNR